ncbi:Response regulator [Sphingomonas sp. RIT328]|nr:Response regulator [Sphingomonas sp. RIT328]
MNERFSSDPCAPDRSPADTVSGDGQSDEASSPRILLIDDNPAVARAMEIAFRLAGHRFDVAVDPEEGLSRLARHRYDAILLDLNFTAGRADGEEGLACLARIIAADPAACVLVLTAHSGIRIAVAAMQSGARDFVMKPWRNAELIAKVTAAIARGPLAAAAAPTVPGSPPPVLIGDSAAMQQLRALIARVGPTPASVSISGPPGSGRSLAASAIHAASRDPAPPLRLDLRDAADWPRLDGAPATLILRRPDALDAQAQQRLVDRLPADTRCIAIVDDAAALMPALRRRIATLDIAMPPLAARAGDALLLARHFLRAACDRFDRPSAQFTEAAAALILATDWPDSVRGLALAVERAALLAEGDRIDAASLALPESAPPPAAAAAATPVAEPGFALSQAERATIEAALREHRHNVSHAAAALGISRGALYRRMARYGL